MNGLAFIYAFLLTQQFISPHSLSFYHSQGVKIKMDDAGNVLIRRYSRNNVYVKNTSTSPKDETSMSSDILKLPNQALELDKVGKLFDVKKFQSNIRRELKEAYPDRRRLESQCLSAISFVRTEDDVLDCPIWVLVINVVAMDMLKSKLPPSKCDSVLPKKTQLNNHKLRVCVWESESQ